MNISKSMKLAAIHSGVSQQEVSRETGIGTPHLSLISNGHKNPSIYSLGKIAKAYGYRVSEFIKLGEQE